MVLSGLLQNIPLVSCIFWYTYEPLAECGIKNFEFIVSEQVQVNPDY